MTSQQYSDQTDADFVFIYYGMTLCRVYKCK